MSIVGVEVWVEEPEAKEWDLKEIERYCRVSADMLRYEVGKEICKVRSSHFPERYPEDWTYRWIETCRVCGTFLRADDATAKVMEVNK